MRVLMRDLKNNRIKLLVETLDDLWHLEHIIEPGDMITSKTFRKTVIKRGESIEHGDRKPVILTIEAEKTEFQKDSGLLRITGPIVSGPEDIQLRSYHTIQVDLNKKLTVQKKLWKSPHLERIERARIKKPLLLICVLDREEANFAVLKESGIEMKASIVNRNKERMEDYHKEILRYLEKQREFKRIVLGGPGFERENLFKLIERENRKLSDKVILEHSSSTGIHGVQEIVKKSANRVLRETRVSEESKHVEEFLKRIRKDGLAVYGLKETEKAVAIGAVETLMVSENMVRDFEKIMETVEKQRGKIIIIGSDHELGEQFLHLGGIGGFLRFRVE